jgi:hypothetical protein
MKLLGGGTSISNNDMSTFLVMEDYVLGWVSYR